MGQFGAGVYLKNSSALETGITLATGGSAGNSFAIGAKYALASDACIRAKVNNTSQIGLSYEQKLRDGIKMTLSTNLDGTKLNEPGHKLGQRASPVVILGFLFNDFGSDAPHKEIFGYER